MTVTVRDLRPELPSDVERFADVLADAVAAAAAQFGGPRRYRVFLGGVPT
jgi:hypothetical protein